MMMMMMMTTMMSFCSLVITLISVTLFVPIAVVSGADMFSNTSTSTTTNDDDSSMRSYSSYNRELTYPEIWDVDELEESNKILTLDLDWLEIDPGFRDDENDENEKENDETSSSSSSTATATTSSTRRSTPFVTRALGGSVPGPTIKVSPGTTVKIKFRNQLTYQPESQSSRRFDVDVNQVDSDVESSSSSVDLSRLNKFNDPDTANLHCHGCHISAVLPSDDTTLQVGPQTEYEYEFTFPLDHSPGMYWLHPHHHGSSTLHLVGGAALAIIVKDPEDPTTTVDRTATAPATTTDSTTTIRNTSSETVTSVKERILIFQDWDIPEAIQVARMAGDQRIEQNWSQNIQHTRVGASIGQRFVTINGMYHPIITSASLNSESESESESESNSKRMECGKWERWRILYAGWQDLPLNLGVQQDQNQNQNNNGANCEFYLLAKDGIYLTDYPRGPMMTTTTTTNDDNHNNQQLPIPPGGRTDLMVRCNRTGTTKFEALSRRNILTIQLNCESSSGSSSSNHDNDKDNNDASNSNSTTITTITTTTDDNDDDDDDDEEEDHDNDSQSVDKTTTADQTTPTTTTTKAAIVIKEADESESSSISSSFSIPPPLVLLVENNNNSNNGVPDYLQSVLDAAAAAADTDTTTVTPGCSCATKFDGYGDTSRINDEIYRPGNRFIHTSYLGATIERKLIGMDEHSYHQHVYPFQLIDFPTAATTSTDKDNDNDARTKKNEYFQVGDWHDTYLDKNQKTNSEGPVTIRYRTTTFAGKMMIHCHNTLHADEGMIQKEYVRNVTVPTADTNTNADAATTCVCDSFQPIAGVGIIDDVEHATVLVGKEQRQQQQEQGTLSTTSSNAAGLLGGRRFCFNIVAVLTVVVLLRRVY